ncbi:MAG TPA: formimidoylglutamate deiminase [Acidimicrobiales bacterium]
MTTWWCERAWLGDPAGATEAGVVITSDDDRITDVETGVAAPAGSERLAGLTIPGAANAHSHAFHRALRGRTHGDGGTFWTWRDTMYDLAGRLDPDNYLALATATFAEMALAGFTCVGEFHYLHHGPDGVPYADPNEMGETIRAAAEGAGIRLTLLDTCYLHAGPITPLLPPDSVAMATASGARTSGWRVEGDPVQRRFSDGDAAAWAARVDELQPTDMSRIGAAIHSVRAVDPVSIEQVSAWADGADAPLHAHVSEQPAENEQCRAAYGLTPTRILAHHGALGDRFTAVHATHLSGQDLAVLAGSGAGCCICPTTERDLADGIGPTAALRERGAPLCIGTDSHAVIDPFEEARAVELDERLASGERGTHPPASLLAMATSEGYGQIGWPEGGRIEVGALADLTTVALDSPRLAGTPPDQVVASVVFGATAADVHHVVVGGRTVVSDGRHLSVDVAQELERSIEAVWA